VFAIRQHAMAFLDVARVTAGDVLITAAARGSGRCCAGREEPAATVIGLAGGTAKQQMVEKLGARTRASTTRTGSGRRRGRHGSAAAGAAWRSTGSAAPSAGAGSTRSGGVGGCHVRLRLGGRDAAHGG
jgi:hypothetical protein